MMFAIIIPFLSVATQASNVDELLVKFAALEGRVSHLEEENRLLKQQVEHLIDENALPKEDNTTGGALSVFFSAKAGPGVYLRDDIIIFEEVTSRVGEGYNEDLGVFRVPVSGYYLFMVTIQKETENDFYDNSFDINLNGQAMSGMNHYQTPDIEGRLNWSSSMQIILPCEIDDFVWVELTPLNDLGKIRGIGGDQFTGLLLSAGL